MSSEGRRAHRARPAFFERVHARRIPRNALLRGLCPVSALSEVECGCDGSGGEKGWKIVFSGFGPDGIQGFPDDGLKTMAASIGVMIDGDGSDGRWESGGFRTGAGRAHR